MNHRRYAIVLTLFMMLALSASAQKDVISGRVVDKVNGSVMGNATLQLYQIRTRNNQSKDTSYVAGTLSDKQGRFTFHVTATGTYMLKATYLGYQEVRREVMKVGGSNVSLGDLVMETSAMQLEEAIVTANIPKMVIRDDTVVYNADAFRVPEGSVIESLVEALPGAKIDDNGGITINGKTVKKFKMDGRDFMTGNNDAVMKNLPSYVVDQVKAYEEKSDLSRLTGLDDGNDDFVLEFVTKRSARPSGMTYSMSFANPSVRTRMFFCSSAL